MGNLTGADWAIFAVSAYVAVTSIVRLMRIRRERLLVEFRQKMSDEQKRKAGEARKAAQKARQKSAA